MWQLLGHLTAADMCALCSEVLSGLVYLHEDRRTVHRDIKAANILLTAAGGVKLADFGVSARMEGTLAHTVIGTPHWMSPEVITGAGYDGRADVWSLGITVVEMATGEPPHFSLPTALAAMFRIVNGAPPEPPAALRDHPPLVQLLSRCFVKEPAKRPTSSQVLAECAAVARPDPAQLAALAARAIKARTAKCAPGGASVPAHSYDALPEDGAVPQWLRKTFGADVQLSARYSPSSPTRAQPPHPSLMRAMESHRRIVVVPPFESCKHDPPDRHQVAQRRTESAATLEAQQWLSSTMKHLSSPSSARSRESDGEEGDSSHRI